MIKLDTRTPDNVRHDFLYEKQREKNNQPLLTLSVIRIAIEKTMKDLPDDWTERNTRQQNIMYARHMGRYIAYNFTSTNIKIIARYFGGRHHPVIYNSQRVINHELRYLPNSKWSRAVKDTVAYLNNFTWQSASLTNEK